MKQLAILLPAALFTLIASLLATGWLFYGYSSQVMLFPAVTGMITGMLCLLSALAARKNRAGPERAATEAGDGEHRGPLLQVVAIIPLLMISGFLVGPAIYTTGLLKHRGESWRMACGLGLATLLFIYVVFVKLLKVSLPTGLLAW